MGGRSDVGRSAGRFGVATLTVGLTVGLAVWLAGCAAGSAGSTTSGGSGGGSRVVRVVAAENFWGSIAAQLGGAHVQVSSIIVNPNADPHDYEPTAADGRAIATADLVLINGVGYDTWASRLADANPNPNRTVLTVGTLLGVPQDGNPHRWYNPDDVHKVIDALTGDYRKLDPADATAFTTGQRTFETTTLAGYTALIGQIKGRYAGTPVGASESIFAMLAPALGLDLITPPTFLRAISQGSDPTAADKASIDAQIKTGQMKVYVYNDQNATPDIQTQITQAKAAGIPVTTITETMVPATGTWQAWQTHQLQALADALAKATGR